MIDNNFFPILSVFKLPITDFPKTVGPDRQKCSRTDDFKIYIGPNVR